MEYFDGYIAESNNYFYYEINTENTELLELVKEKIDNWHLMLFPETEDITQFPIKEYEEIAGDEYTIVKGAYYEHSTEFYEILDDDVFIAINDAVNKAADGSCGYNLLVDHDKDQFVFCGGMKKTAVTAEECKNSEWFKLSDIVYDFTIRNGTSEEQVSNMVLYAIGRDDSLKKRWNYNPEKDDDRYWLHSALIPDDGKVVDIYFSDTKTILSGLDEYASAAKKMKEAGVTLYLLDEWDSDRYPLYLDRDENYIGFVSKDGKYVMVITTDKNGNYSVEYIKLVRG